MSVQDAEATSQQREVGGDGGEDILGVVHQVDLVHHQDDVRHPQQGRNSQVPARLFDHTLARIDQQHDDIGGGGPGHGVAGVLHVPRAVGQDELPGRRGEVAVRDVDRDALLALSTQAVGEQRKIGRSRPLRLLTCST